MSKYPKPDEHLLACPDREEIIHRVKELEDIHRLFHTNRLPFGLTGPLFYMVPVAWEPKDSNVDWYGVEFYVEFHRIAENVDKEWEDYPEYAAKIADSILVRSGITEYGLGGIKEGRCLDRGWEIALPSLPIDKICEYLHSVISDRHIAPYLRHNGNALMHVTVEPFDTPEQQRVFHDFWNHPWLFSDFYWSIHRVSSAPDTKQRRTYKFKKDGFMQADKEWAHIHRCSVRKNGAMELRIFRASHYIDSIRSQLEMVDIVNKAVRSSTDLSDCRYDRLCHKLRRYYRR